MHLGKEVYPSELVSIQTLSVILHGCSNFYGDIENFVSNVIVIGADIRASLARFHSDQVYFVRFSIILC